MDKYLADRLAVKGIDAVKSGKQVHFFLMEWLEGVPAPRDGEMEQVYWCPLERAAGELTFETERVALARARQRLEAVLEAAGPGRA